MRFAPRLLLPLALCALAGCAAPNRAATPLPEGFSVKELALVDDGTPLAAARTGELAATYKGAIETITEKGIEWEMPEAPAFMLSFSPSGDRLAAALHAESRTTLRIIDRSGSPIAVTSIPGRVSAMTWRSDTELLLTAITVTRPAAGPQLAAQLYLWNGSTPPTATMLAEAAVPTELAQVPEAALAATVSLAVSPYGDEIAYSSPKCHPAYAPCQTITIRHLETGRERVIGRTALGSGGPLYTPDGESLIVGEQHALTRRLSIPDGREMYAWPAAGSHPAISPAGSYLLLDGRLYQTGKALASFPSDTLGTFLPDGSGLAITYDGKLYLLSGLKEPALKASPLALDRLLKLRRLRSLGLISEKEYRGRKAGLP